jgi:hypothetical protein
MAALALQRFCVDLWTLDFGLIWGRKRRKKRKEKEWVDGGFAAHAIESRSMIASVVVF